MAATLPPVDPLAQQAVDAIHSTFGEHEGRAVHVKGAWAKGTFTATPEGADLCRAPFLTGDPVHEVPGYRVSLHPARSGSLASWTPFPFRSSNLWALMSRRISFTGRGTFLAPTSSSLALRLDPPNWCAPRARCLVSTTPKIQK